ncbi:deaminase [Candidatus Thiodiazotropha sp. LNASS1]|uniref:deaminase n=1 Tax=Candidatus Thiodiazotropha sp. LNASS1 TaxID=3096260 RepID=UPI0034DF2ADA
MSEGRLGSGPSDAGFNDLADRRDELGLPTAGSDGDNATLAKLVINGNTYYGINSSLQSPRTEITLTRVNAQTRTHAEAEVVQKAINDGNAGTAGIAEMWVDRDPCRACGAPGNGLRSLARNLGVDELIVHGPSGTQIYTPTN